MVTDTHDRTLDHAVTAREVDDDVLRELSEALPPPAPAEPAERDEEAEAADRGTAKDPPFNLALPAPRAIDLRRLWKLAGKTPDPMILANFGRRVPVLLSHGVTALPRPGRKPARVWGLGYKVELFGVAADTVDVQPATDLLDVATVGAEATVEIGLDGSLEVPRGASDALNAVPGVTLTAARIRAAVNETAKLSISFTLSVPRIISGPGDGHGGAEWSLYAQDKRLEGHQALLQTLLVPTDATRLEIGVTGWAREAGLFGRPREWVFETATFSIDLER